MRPWLTIAWAAVLVAGLAASGCLWLAHHRSASRDAAGQDALDTARTSITRLLSYRGGAVAKQLSATQGLLTPSYAGAYRGMLLSEVAPTARSAGAQVAASVVAGGVVSADADDAVTLLYVDLATRTSVQSSPVTTGSRLQVSLQHENGRWLISDIRPL